MSESAFSYETEGLFNYDSEFLQIQIGILFKYSLAVNERIGRREKQP
jgi:hypothetical protein